MTIDERLQRAAGAVGQAVGEVDARARLDRVVRRGRRRTAAAVASAACVVALALAAGIVVADRQPGRPATATPVAAPAAPARPGRLAATIPIGGDEWDLSDLAEVGGRIWVTRSRGPLAIDPRTNGVTRLPVRIDPGRGRRSIAQFTVAGGGVWAHVADESVGSTHLERIDPVSLRVTARWRPPPRPRAFARDPVGGAGGLWVTVHRSAATGRESDVRRLDAVTGRELARLPVAASELAADDTTVVAVDVDGRAAVLIDPADGSVRPLATPPPEGRGFLDAAIGYGSAWLPSYGGILTRVDLVTRTVHRISIPAATPPGGREDGSAVTRVAVGAGSVWALTATGHVVRVDPARNRPVGVVGGLGSARGATRRYFDDILVTEDAVWVAAEDGGRPVVLRIDPDR